MPKGIPKKNYTSEFKKQVVKTIPREKLSYRETERIYGITSHTVMLAWERIYLEEEPEGFAIEHRGRSSKGQPRKLSKEIGEDLLGEVLRLRTENDCLKNLQTLVLENERRQRRKRR